MYGRDITVQYSYVLTVDDKGPTGGAFPTQGQGLHQPMRFDNTWDIGTNNCIVKPLSAVL